MKKNSKKNEWLIDVYKKNTGGRDWVEMEKGAGMRDICNHATIKNLN